MAWTLQESLTPILGAPVLCGRHREVLRLNHSGLGNQEAECLPENMEILSGFHDTKKAEIVQKEICNTVELRDPSVVDQMLLWNTLHRVLSSPGKRALEGQQGSCPSLTKLSTGNAVQSSTSLLLAMSEFQGRRQVPTCTPTPELQGQGPSPSVTSMKEGIRLPVTARKSSGWSGTSP